MKKNRRINAGAMPSFTDTLFVLNGASVDEGKRLVTGYMDSGEPNNQGYLLDYPTTKPYILKYVERFEKATGGISKGAVRPMHQPVVVGKIVAMTLDDETYRILVTVRVDVDEEWQKVIDHDYTAFSGHWSVVGAMWEDKAATAKYGRKIMRYTGDPVEVSLLDVPRVPGCEFQKIENGFTEDEMKDVLEKLTTVNQQLRSVANGVGVGNDLACLFENLAWLYRYIQREETAEGEDQAIPDALKAALLALKIPIQEYQVKQLDELISEDTDYEVAFKELQSQFPEEAFNGMSEIDFLRAVVNGDLPGHPFHGNQHVSSEGSASASSKAHAATLHANEKGSKGSHARAAAAHAKAAEYHNQRGNAKAAAFHAKASSAHGKIASSMKNGDDTEMSNGQTTTINHKENQTMTPEEIQAITNGIGVAVTAALKPMQEAIEAIKASAVPAPVANGQNVPVPQLGGTLLQHDHAPAPVNQPTKITNGSVCAVIDAIPAEERSPITIAAALEAAGLLEA